MTEAGRCSLETGRLLRTAVHAGSTEYSYFDVVEWSDGQVYQALRHAFIDTVQYAVSDVYLLNLTLFIVPLYTTILFLFFYTRSYSMYSYTRTVPGTQSTGVRNRGSTHFYGPSLLVDQEEEETFWFLPTSSRQGTEATTAACRSSLTKGSAVSLKPSSPPRRDAAGDSETQGIEENPARVAEPLNG